jgi:hypothetical protein
VLVILRGTVRPGLFRPTIGQREAFQVSLALLGDAGALAWASAPKFILANDAAREVEAVEAKAGAECSPGIVRGLSKLAAALAALVT